MLAATRRFAAELERKGFEVRYRRAPSLAEGLAAHRRAHAPPTVHAMEPCSWDAEQLLRALGVSLVRSNALLCGLGRAEV